MNKYSGSTAKLFEIRLVFPAVPAAAKPFDTARQVFASLELYREFHASGPGYAAHLEQVIGAPDRLLPSEITVPSGDSGVRARLAPRP